MLVDVISSVSMSRERVAIRAIALSEVEFESANEHACTLIRRPAHRSAGMERLKTSRAPHRRQAFMQRSLGTAGALAAEVRTFFETIEA